MEHTRQKSLGDHEFRIYIFHLPLK